MFDSIILPLDGSELAERAIPYAAELGRGFGTPLTIVRVLSPFTNFPDPYAYKRVDAIVAQEKADATAYIEGKAEELRGTGLDVEGVLRMADPAETILEVASGKAAPLIAMATHGRGGLARWAFGSVAERIVRGADAPVFLVPAFADKRPPMQRFLVPLDGSDLAEAVLPVAAELVRRLGGEIVLFRAFIPEAKSERLTAWEAREYLEHRKQVLTEQGVAVGIASQRGEAAEEIIGYAGAHGVDAILMSTHGRGGIARWALGSVADRVLRAAPAPVLLRRARVPQGAQATPLR
jgi:nucleotide-binding universal stress UspA family protein